MSKLYACLISPDAEKAALIAVATEFAYRIELLEDGILFDLSGLEKLIGTPRKIAAKILATMETHLIAGNLVINANLETAILLARQSTGLTVTNSRLEELSNSANLLSRLPLTSLPLKRETLNIFDHLGWREIRDLQQIPTEDLLSRYGTEFLPILDLIKENSRRTLTPNLPKDFVFWESDLDTSIIDFEQLMSFIDLALGELFPQVLQTGKSCEHLEIHLFLEDESAALYQVKASQPTLDQPFWMKIVALKISAQPPTSAIQNLKVTVHLTKPRPSQNGLFAVVRPEPESLQLTVNKLKRLLGDSNVGIPVLLNERLPEAFALKAEKMPEGIEPENNPLLKPSPGFCYFVPPLAAQVLIRRKQLVYLKTSRFAGRVLAYSGVWKRNSRWWEKEWKTYEWDVELEKEGIYRLCKRSQEWFVVGEYD